MIHVQDYLPLEEMLQWNLEHDLGLTTRTVRKGEVFLEAGQRCDHLYFILTGMVRTYYYDLEGHDMTHLFSDRGSITTSPLSYFKGEPNILYLEALEDSELIPLRAEQIERVQELGLMPRQTMQRILLDFGMMMSRRVMGIHTLRAEERYLKLMEQHPTIFQKAQMGHIASYLGITPQSLSRIRKQIVG